MFTSDKSGVGKMRPLRLNNAFPWMVLVAVSAMATVSRDSSTATRTPGAGRKDGDSKRMDAGAAALADGDDERTVPTAALTGRGRSASRDGVKLGRTEMRLDASMPLDHWKSIGSRIGSHSDATCWWLGDWLAFGREMYGVRYHEGIAMTGLEYKTLRNYAVVARAFDSSRRRHELSFHHHAEVTALPLEEQDFWLDLSVKHNWSKSELRRQVRARTRTALAGPASTSLALALQDSRHARWLEAAQRSDRTLKQWAMAVLDEAAADVLESPALTAGDT
jgi:hypothetical protein